MDGQGRIRWGIVGTANIARASFLPGLREAGGGVALAVAGRDPERTEAFARANGVERAVVGYTALVDDPDIDAVYVPLPNTLHAQWTIRALEAGKAVFTEKPLCVSPRETQQVLDAARRTGALLWEAFVFPFQPQMARVRELIGSGAIGELREINAELHFQVRGADNIRFDPDLAGGALNDVGCYPIHLAGALFGTSPTQAAAAAVPAPSGVDLETRGVLTYDGGRALVFSCGLARPASSCGRILGTRGEIRLTRTYHPGPDDTLELARYGEGVAAVERPTRHERPFSPAIDHIHRVLRGEAAPEHLAIDEAMATATALQMVREAAAAGGSH